MKSREVDADGRPEYVIVLETGEEVAGGLQRFVREHGIRAARISGVGGFERAKLGFFDWTTKSYVDIPVDEQVEVLSFDGDISLKEDGQPQVHVHVVAGRRDGSTVGGHLMGGTVRPTMEIMVSEISDGLRRVHDEESGLELIDPTTGS
jgi:predicted DNA-binding protein with PD1-like motif